ncbi:unnamed protein product [Prorocentrum cordatum]|uniref:Uncharacterized protein n=1 Tax=Prorocentrum cordatum TaxID=2364126 RepID=A0ABN9TMX5_9DINO|nr:unnamed protein product [Polarella glacialis]
MSESSGFSRDIESATHRSMLSRGRASMTTSTITPCTPASTALLDINDPAERQDAGMQDVFRRPVSGHVGCQDLYMKFDLWVSEVMQRNAEGEPHPWLTWPVFPALGCPRASLAARCSIALQGRRQ